MFRIKSNFLNVTILWALLLPGLFSACSASKHAVDKGVVRQSCYQRQIIYEEDDHIQPLDELTLDSALTSRYNKNSLQIAHAFQLIPLLEQLTIDEKALQENSDIENRLSLLETRQSLLLKLQEAHVQISAVESELDCEEELTEQVASALQQKVQKREQRLTIAAITTGGVSGLLSGIVLSRNPGSVSIDLIGIGSLLIEVGIGATILFTGKKVTFKHEVNPLRDVWEGDGYSETISPPVWYYLNHYTTEKEALTLREQVINQWLSNDQLGDGVSDKKKEKNHALLFGEGGRYDADLLNIRADMFDQLGAYIALMKQDLDQLMSQIKYDKLDR